MTSRGLLSLRGCELVAGRTPIAKIDSFELRRGELCVIQGESGAGKTSFLRALTGADPFAELRGGEFRLDARDPRELTEREAARARRETIGFLPQIASSTFEPMRRLDRQFGLRTSDLGTLRTWLERLDGEGGEQARSLLGRRPFAVSGGQAQRIAMASVLARGRRLLLLDEPTVGLDRERWTRLRDVLIELASGETYSATVLATHDRELVADLGAAASVRVLHFGDGELRQGAAPAIEFPEVRPCPTDSRWCLRATGLQVRPGRGASLTPELGLELHPSRVTALLGSSGLGKTTVARCLAGLLEPARGKIDFDGVGATGASSVHLVSQDALASMPVGRTVGSILTEVVEHGPEGRIGEVSEVCGFLRELELPSEAWSQPAESLSGGELRRVAVVRGVASGARVLVVDEPTAGLDARRAGVCIAFLQRMAETRRMAMLWITHDRALAERSAHEVIRWGNA
ncbi:MAG: ATP-binding cassette domain-containing protein [Planctomycetota bacterium]